MNTDLQNLTILDLTRLSFTDAQINPERVTLSGLNLGMHQSGPLRVLENQYGKIWVHIGYRCQTDYRHKQDYLRIEFPDFNASSVPRVIVNPDAISLQSFPELHHLSLASAIVARFCTLEIVSRDEGSKWMIDFKLSFMGQTYIRELDYASEEDQDTLIKWRFNREHK